MSEGLPQSFSQPSTQEQVSSSTIDGTALEHPDVIDHTRASSNNIPEPSNVLSDLTTVWDKLPGELIAQILLEAAGPGQLRRNNPLDADAIERGALAFEKDVLQLSHVCQLFLQVVRATPYLWTTITRLDSPQLVEKVLQLSGGLAFRVVQVGPRDKFENNSHDPDNFARAMSLILQHRDRCEILSCRPVDYEDGAYLHQKVLADETLHLPLLRTLDVWCPYEGFVVGFEDIPDFGHLLRNKCPQLTTLSVPDYMQDSCTVESLTQVEIIGARKMLLYHEGIVVIPVASYIEPLLRLANLHTLKLSLDYIRNESILFCPLDREIHLLPSLRHLELSVSTHATIKFMVNFLSFTNYPNLECFNLSLSNNNDTVVDDDASLLSRISEVCWVLSSNHCSFAHLKRFRLSRQLTLIGANSSMMLLDDLEMLGNMWNLREVRFDYLLAGHTWSSLAQFLPLVERVHIYSCGIIELKVILNTMKNRILRGYATVTEVRVEKCNLLSRECADNWEELMRTPTVATSESASQNEILANARIPRLVIVE